MPHLTLPSTTYKASFLAAIKEYQAENLKNYRHLDISELEKDFSAYIQQQLDEAKGEGLPEGYVPHTIYWLVEDDQYLGRVDIRHTLTDSLKKLGGHIGYDIRPTQRRKGYGSLVLKLALQKAKQLGITDALVTCDVDNIGSNKIIQKNGGKLEGTKKVSDTLTKNHYWIEVR